MTARRGSRQPGAARCCGRYLCVPRANHACGGGSPTCMLDQVDASSTVRDVQWLDIGDKVASISAGAISLVGLILVIIWRVRDERLRKRVSDRGLHGAIDGAGGESKDGQD